MDLQENDKMEIFSTTRSSGKTRRLVEWVKEGKETNSYPFWTRVILVSNLPEADLIRRFYSLDYRQVYTITEWKNAHLGSIEVEIAIDNADEILARLVGTSPRMLKIITVTNANMVDMHPTTDLCHGDETEPRSEH